MKFTIPVRQEDGSYREFDTLRKGYGPGSSLEEFLFSKPRTLKLYCITTWECTLRCGYCYVLQNLKRNDRFTVDVPATIAFLKRYIAWNEELKNVRMVQIGGEPFSAMDNVAAYSEIAAWLRSQGLDVKMVATSNLTVLPDDLAPLAAFDSLAVSLDGDEEAHNAVRKNASLPEGTNVFRTTIRNLYRLVQNNPGIRKIHIQSAMGDEMLSDPVRVRTFRFILEAIGIEPKHINVGCIAPTNGRAAIDAYARYQKAPGPSTAPCCIFRPMGFICLHDNKIYASYFDRTQLGDLNSDPAELFEKASAYVRNTMPILQDPVCQTCDVVGYCWGNCYGDESFRHQPSTKCAREHLRGMVQTAAEDGTLPLILHNRPLTHA